MQNGPDLLLVHPGSNKRVYGALADEYAAIEPPFAATLTAGFVRDRGYSVEILDANALGLSIEETAEKVKEYSPGLINIIVHGHQPSASSHLMDVVGDLCREIKGRINTPILLRGIHPSSLPERTLREESCDYIARGEGFQTLLGLLGDGLSEIPGLCYIDGDGNFVANRSPELIKSLDSVLANVAWDLLPMERYRAHNWHAFDTIDGRSPYASLYTSLGCPFTCSFCCINAEFKVALSDNKKGNSQLGGSGLNLLQALDATKPTIRYWGADTVIKHVDYLVGAHGVKHLKFIDEMFVLDRKHVSGICDKIIERGYGLNIWAYARVDTLEDLELIDKMKKAGINWLVIGIESGSKHVRDGARKKYENEDIFKSVRRVQNAGINVVGNYIYGLPDDTHDSMQATLELAKELNTEWYNGYAAMAYPGAPLYSIAQQRGIPLPGDHGVPGGWTAYSHHSYYTLPLPTDTLSAAEVLEFRDDAFIEYMRNSSFISLVRKKFGEGVVRHIDEMSNHRLKRRILGD